MKHDAYDRSLIRGILLDAGTIAVVGASADPTRSSDSVMEFLIYKSYHVIPVNPKYAGSTIQDQKVLATLADIDERIDIVGVFRNVDHRPAVVDEVIALERLPRVIWGQLSVRNDVAAEKAELKGITVIMDRCLSIEYHKYVAS